jgi:hypothetical protein
MSLRTGPVTGMVIMIFVLLGTHTTAFTVLVLRCWLSSEAREGLFCWALLNLPGVG